MAHLHDDYISSLETLKELRKLWKAKGLHVVLTNGVFDILHYGHIRFLYLARSQGDILIVGLNSEISTRALKGSTRPIMPEHERAMVVLALKPVDYVTIFHELTADHLLNELKPDIYVKGGDYILESEAQTSDLDIKMKRKILQESKVVFEYGGRVELVPYLPMHSTTLVIRKIVGGQTAPE